MSLKQLVIVGAGDLGREAAMLAKSAKGSGTSWRIKGFIDDGRQHTDVPCGVPVLGSIAAYRPDQEDIFVCAVASPRAKLSITAELRRRGARFTNLIHPTALIGSDNILGEGLLIFPYTVITTNVTIGDHVTINMHSSIGHDAVLEEGVTLSPRCDITGYVRLGRGVFLGSGATMLPKSSAEEFAYVGAGSVVLKKVRAHKTVFGVPAAYIN